MDQPEPAEIIEASTTWAWKHVTIDPPPAAQAARRRRPRKQDKLPPWDPKSALTVVITYRGGAEAWYELRTRGRTFRMRGDLGIHDVMRRVHGLD